MSDWRSEYERWEREVAAGRAQTSWSSGGRDEPLWAKLRRDSRLADLPDWIPPLCAEAARGFLDHADNAKYVNEVERILHKDPVYRNPPYQRFWLEVEDALRSSATYLHFHSDGSVEAFFRRFILLMTYKGGRVYLRKSMTSQRNGRQIIATALRTALQKIRADDYLERVRIADPYRHGGSVRQNQRRIQGAG